MSAALADNAVAVSLTLSRKACARLTFACVIILLMGLFVFGLQTRLYQSVATVTRHDAASRTAASELAVSLVQCRRYENDLLRDLHIPLAFRAAEERWSRSWEGLCNALHELQATSSDAAERGQLECYLTAARDYREKVLQLSDLARQGRLTDRGEAERILAVNRNDSRPTVAEAVVVAQGKVDTDSQTATTLANSACLSVILTGTLTLLSGGLMFAGLIWLRVTRDGVFRRGTTSQAIRITTDHSAKDNKIFDDVGQRVLDASGNAAVAIPVAQTFHPDDFIERRLLDSVETIAAEVVEQAQPQGQRPVAMESPISRVRDDAVAHGGQADKLR